MKTNSLVAAAALAVALIGTGAHAQSADQPPGSPAPNQIVYLPQLPAPAELARTASGQGIAIAQIVQAGDEVTVVYKQANGRTSTVAYRLLSAVDSSAVPVPSSPVASFPPSAPPAPATGPAPVYAPATVYAQPAPVYYYPQAYYPAAGYPAADYYYPWYAPIAVNLGFGWGWHGGGYSHGGYGGRWR